MLGNPEDLLVAFDGTWAEDTFGNPKNDTVVSRLTEEWGGRWLYVPGVGTRLGPFGKLFGGAFGLGSKGRVQEAERHVRVWRDQHPEGRLAIVGWSRGAVQALRLSEALYAAIPSEVVVLLDPVPGPSPALWGTHRASNDPVWNLRGTKPRNPFFARLRVRGPGVVDVQCDGDHSFMGRDPRVFRFVRGLLAERCIRGRTG